MAKAITDETLMETVDAVNEAGGDRQKVSADLGLADRTIRDRLKRAVARGLVTEAQITETPIYQRDSKISGAEIAATVKALKDHGGNAARAAKALGITRNQMGWRIQQAEIRSDWMPTGSVDSRRATKMPLPEVGAVKRYILTCAQSETKLHEPTWNAIHTAAAHYGAEIMVATFSYKHRQEGSAKRGTAKHQQGEDWYDPRIEAYVVDDMVQLGKGLTWNGHMNILPTATDPLSGMDNYNGRSSSVFPHAKVAMKSIPTVQTDPAKFQYTTGTVTLRNYIQKKAGQKAEFDHVYGALLVEVDHEGYWFARQLSSDRRGTIRDLQWEFKANGEVGLHDGIQAVVWGDVHVAQLETDMININWDGPGSIIDSLNPKEQYLHDLLDFESRSHHNVRDPFILFKLHTEKRESVEDEIKDVGAFLRLAHRDNTRSIVVTSNHDLHLERWLREADWKKDPINAEFYMAAAGAYLKAIKTGVYFNALKWAVAKYMPVKGVKWLSPDDSKVICKSSSGGIEMGLHGDRGPNGARGSIRNLSKLGRKVVIGHSHSAGIYNGAWQTGVTARLGMDYAKGSPSSWSQSHVIVHSNGKRQLITVYKGRWRL